MEVIIGSLYDVFSLNNIIFMILGVTLGIIFGALPGLTATMGVAVLLPITFGMEPTTGILFLLSVYCGGIYGASIPAILIKTPGSPASAATIVDGAELVKKGKAGEALRATVFASAIAGFISALILMFVAPQLAKFALKFGPTEYFAIALFGLTMIAKVSAESVLKGVFMGFLGMFVAAVGMDPVSGVPRFTFGNVNLLGGLALVPVLVGLFAITEIFIQSQTAHVISKPKQTKILDKPESIWKLFKYWKTIIKSTFIGTFIGMIPGTGAPLASFLSYNESRRSSKNKKEYGKGSMEGIVASEAGNNGVTGATLVPLLTLGIPGDTVTAILLGALLIQGLNPGPQLFTEHADVMYGIMIGLLVINIIMFIQGRVASRLFAKVTSIPMNVLIPILITLCFVGSYAVNNTIFDVKVMIIFGLIGFVMTKLNYPLIPMLLGIVLGPIAEPNLRKALINSNGDWSVFLTQPISLVFVVLSLLTIFMPLIKQFILRIRGKKAAS
ncbi:tripartite tricarboxylate transporter permease [Lentibacillus amyloliquefaciens]|uniref:C4-dicarboxylate ABC transporter permease n=1 Tax=Lentibacillus amyloliquefaciens TaxID=1472767 RepID=A0A0U3W334_9BACI|nr:tripartite tricarboxylate transporter permease [Lentibacillus amyloliquefaciens]ALX47568.1 C4-dicarboxylate ABC transporter permease [Lentibacillus amyloliquefaciens]